jgi:hypothetical protein
MADCERGMGRPERALELAVSDEARHLDFDGQVEMLIVAAGARTDLGQLDAAVVTLQVPELKSKAKASWLARLRSAYADALTAVGRTDEAQDWLRRALEADVDGEAGIAERLGEDDGLVFEDLGVGFEDGDVAVDEDGDVLPEPAAVNAPDDDDDAAADAAADTAADAAVDDGDSEDDAPQVEQPEDDDSDDEPAPAPVAAPPVPATTGLFQEPPALAVHDDEDDEDDDDSDDEPTGEEAKA